MAFEIYRGADFTADLAWTDENGAAKPATGGAISAVLKYRLSHEEIGPITIAWIDDSQGTSKITMSEADTMAAPRGGLTYIDVTIVTAAGETSKFIGGEVIAY